MLRFSFLFVLTLCDYAKFITDDKYAAFITENPTTIVAFYTPPNNKLMKEYENAAKKLLAIPIRIAMVDCTKEKKTCQKENIKAYPTLKIFKNGISQDYKGDHTSLAIVDTMSTVAKTEQDILDENKSDLVEVTDLAYSQFIKDNKISLIMFHAPWCGHCQNLKPHFELAASELLSQDIILATVDCTTEKHICSKHDIKGYPTLKYFKNRVVSDYVGGRSTEEIVQVMSNGNKLIVEENPDIFTLTSANHEQFLKDNKVTLLKFYAPWCGHCKTLAPIYAEAAKKLLGKSIKIAEVNCDVEKTICEQYGVSAYPSLKYFEKGVHSEFIYRGAAQDIFEAVMNGNKLPVEEETDVFVLDASNHKKFIETNNVTLIEYYAPWCGHCKNLKPIYENAATLLKGEFKLAKVDCDSQKSICNSMNITSYPSLKFFENGIDVIILGIASDFIGTRDVDGIVETVRLGNKPPVEEPSDVLALTKETYSAFVSTGITLVEYYTSWCGHCKALKPIYAKAATKLLEVKIQIAKVNCEEEGAICEEAGIKGYPSLKYFENGLASDFIGTRHVDGIVETVIGGNKRPVEEPSDVLALTKETYSAFVSTGITLVEYYASWCGHCKALKPIYAKAATKLLEVKIQIAKINCEDERVICEEAGIKSYPSLKYFENGIDVVIVGAASDFIGARDVDGIVDTMRNKNLPPVEPKSDVVTLTFDTFDSFLEHNLVTVVEFYAPWCGHCKKLAPIYSEAATKLLNNNPSIKIAKVNCDFEKKLCEKYKIGSFPTIKYIQNGKMEEFIAERSVDSIVETVKRFNKAVIDDSSDIENDVVVDDSDVVVLKEDTFDQFIVDNVITVIKFYAPWCGHCKALKAPYDNAATILLKSEPPIKIAKVDCTTQQSLCSTHKIDGYPTLKVFRNGVVSDYDGDRTAEAIVADLKKDPNAVKVIKSEPTPVQGDDEAVKVVVGNTFNEIVLDLDKNVLLKVYAPWCGHCKKLAPVWEKLGESSVLSPDIVIAKMDLTLNDMPKLDIKVKGFPTILLFKAKTNEIVEYHGDRSLEGKNSFFVDLKKFVEKHTSAGNLGKQNSGHEEL